ncbi:type II secretion system F family protein [Caulobacter sp. 17J80-11]|uniref:type II secretion system F family protein n=1 Tax=Caulobacter sp. 17J80-11 TaxID=2763502 RepID=UPI0016536F61|nr:type II secretion system F family protein [Caulobacter sp. 17J80-11]MBC6982415.1 type II secretion system F family protein [Caulobacter sp. 17J80-11]
MGLAIIFTMAGLAVLALAIGVAVIVFGDRLFASRLAALAPGAGTPTTRASLTPQVTRALEKLGDRLGKGAVDGEKRGVLRARLVQAGIYADRAVEIFFALRVLSALLFGVGAVVAVAVFKPAGALIALLVVVGAANAGLFLPNLILAHRIGERRLGIRLGLPDAVDLMVVCVEAGSTVTASIQRVSREFVEMHPVLASELEITLRQMQAGSSRADAMSRLAERAPLDELRNLVTMLNQSEALGASLGQTLRVFAEEMRRNRFLEAERKAAELPVKMAIPLVFFVFPCLMGVIFTPVVIRFVRVLFPAMS